MRKQLIAGVVVAVLVVLALGGCQQSPTEVEEVTFPTGLAVGADDYMFAHRRDPGGIWTAWFGSEADVLKWKAEVEATGTVGGSLRIPVQSFAVAEVIRVPRN